jgi:hypothetical protein
LTYSFSVMGLIGLFNYRYERIFSTVTTVSS